MASRNDKFLIHYAEGRGTNLGKASNKVASWGDFKAMLSNPTVTKERRKQFDKMSKEQQDELKSVDGWIIGVQVDDGKRKRRNLKLRDLLHLDIDYATIRLLSDVQAGLTDLSEFEFFCHSTRRHTDEHPRIRLFLPLTRPVNSDEYIALTRILGWMLENRPAAMTQVDKVSFRPAQMMFKPTRSIDGDWWTHENVGEMVDPDAILSMFEETVGPWTDLSLLPKTEDEGKLRASAEKAENPTEKKGPVGDFCRAYDVPAAIEKFLPDCYEPADDFSEKPRYTYLKGTSTSGAVVEDDGLFLYSHHGSDPCADRLVNAFDLVRIHLFGELDADAEEDTPPTKLPSYKRMLEFLADDKEYRRAQAERRYDMTAMFEDMVPEDEDDPDPADSAPKPVEADEDAGEIARLLGLDDDENPVGPEILSGAGFPGVVGSKKRGKPPKGWFPDRLTLDQNGRIENGYYNASVIIQNDARLYGAIAYNEFKGRIVIKHSIRSKLEIAPAVIVRDRQNGDPWQDYHDITVRAILEAPNGEGQSGYGMRITDRDLAGAIRLAAQCNVFHPIREYLIACHEAGIAASGGVETLFIRYLGVEDNAYHREIAKLIMVASVARIFEPGHKFDFAPILQGETGLRKSSFIKALYGEAYFGEIDCNLGDTQAVAEIIAGIWGGELPELQGLHKADHNAAKAFMRREVDTVRMAYDRRVSEFPRQMVVWGSTNDKKYLKDPTGNRSYWPVLVNETRTLPLDSQGRPYINTDALMAERDALWAEAMAIYLAMRADKPVEKGDLPLYIRTPEAHDYAVELQEAARTEELHEIWAERILEWLDTPISLQQFQDELHGRTSPTTFREEGEIDPSEVMVVRCAFYPEQAVEMALKKDRGTSDHQAAANISKAIAELEGEDWFRGRDPVKGGKKTRVQGVQKRWLYRADATRQEQKQGYKVIASAQAGESPDYDLI